MIDLRSQVNYIYGNVVATLAMVEDSRTHIPIPTSDPEENQEPFLKEAKIGGDDESIEEGEDREPGRRVGPAITSSMSGTLKYLRARAGTFSCVRGLAVSVVYSVLWIFTSGIVTWIAGLILTESVASFVGHVLSAVVLAPIELLCAHVIIAEPNRKYWWHRFVPLNKAKKILIPTAVSAVAALLPLYVLGFIFSTFRSAVTRSKDTTTMFDLFFLELVIMVIFLLAYLAFVAIPVLIVVTRIQASLLQEEPIVPFDRTFGGKVVAEEFGGSGVLSMKDAWKTFDQESRFRVMKIFLKLFGINILIVAGGLGLMTLVVSFMDTESAIKVLAKVLSMSKTATSS